MVSATADSTNGFTFWVSLDNKTGEVAFLPFPVIYDAVLEKKIDCDDESTIGGDDAEEIDFEKGLYDDSEERVIIGQMDSNYNVQAGNRGPVENQGHPTIGETAEFRWTTFTSTYAPTDLRAKPKVASTVVRGKTLTLDGVGNLRETSRNTSGPSL